MIASLLRKEFDVVEVVGRGDQILDTVLRTQPTAAVLDVSLPGRSGLQVLPELRQRLPLLPVVMLTTHTRPLYRKEALLRGADAFIVKATAASELLPALCFAIGERASMSSVPRGWHRCQRPRCTSASIE